jgi:hypothetical protein
MDPAATLPVLRRARASLTRGPFSFHDWSECTCGHVYAAATGRAATRRADVRSPRPGSDYARAVIAAAQALTGDEHRFTAASRPWYERRTPAALAVRCLSDATMRHARAAGRRVARADAIAVLDAALARLEAREHARVADAHERPLDG